VALVAPWLAGGGHRMRRLAASLSLNGRVDAITAHRHRPAGRGVPGYLGVGCRPCGNSGTESSPRQRINRARRRYPGVHRLGLSLPASTEAG
jgi:hypothetical protein